MDQGSTQSLPVWPENPTAVGSPFFVQWIVLVAAFLVLGGYIAYSLYEERKTLMSATQDSLSQGVESIALNVERRLTSIDHALLDVRSNLPPLQAEPNGEMLVSMYLKSLQNAVDGLRTVGLFDAQGTIIAASREVLIGQNFRQRAYFITALESKSPEILHVAAPFKSVLGTHSLNLFRRINDAQGNFSGIVSATLDPEDFMPILAAPSFTPEVSVGLIHGSGSVLLYKASPEVPPGTDVSGDGTFFSQHMAGGKAHSVLVGSTPILQGERLAVARTISPAELSMDVPLVVVISQGLPSILRAWHDSVRTQSMLFILLLGLSSFALFMNQSRQRKLISLKLRHQTEQLQAAQSLREGKEFIVGVIDGLLQHVAVLDQQGTIVMVNQAWRNFARDNGASAATLESIGLNYLEICNAAPAHDFGEEAATVMHGIREVLAGRLQEFSMEYPCHSPSEQRWFILHVTRLQNLTSGVVVAHENITLRKLAEREVIESEARFRAFFEHAMVGMATTSLEKGWMLVNPALCSILGYSQDALLQKTWAELTYSDDLAASVESFERISRDEIDCYSAEKRFVRADGAIIHVHIAVRAVRRADRSIDFFAVIIEDISERKGFELQLTQSLRMTQQFLDHLPGTAYVKDENLRVQMASQGFLSILGIDPKIMIGKSNSELFPGGFGAKLDADDAQILAAGLNTTIQEVFEGRYFESIKFVIEGDAGKRLLGGITLDVTQRHKNFERQEALLRISELGGGLPEKEFFGQGIEMLEQLTASKIGFIHQVSEDEQSIELVAWTVGAQMGCTTVHENHYPICDAGVWADCARNKTIAMFNDYPGYRAKRGLPEGHTPLYRLLSVPVIEEGQVRLILGVGNKASDYDDFDCATAQLIGNDLWRIARRVRAEKALKNNLEELKTLNARLDETNNKLLHSEKLASIGQLAAGVAHEINNPIGYVSSNLNSMAGYVEDLLAINADYQAVEKRYGASMPQAFEQVHQRKADVDFDFIVSDIEHLLGESREGLDRVRKIVQDLKDFSRVGGVGWEWFSLQDGLESTLNIVWNEIKYKAEVDREYGELPNVYCIPSQINQVFLNLLTNAAQSIEAHGHIILRSACENDTVWIEVQDSGHGIAPENLEHIFEPFYTTKPVGQGTGLGLSLSWGIVQRHQGRIEVRSLPGQGTTFRVVLPIKPPLEKMS